MGETCGRCGRPRWKVGEVEGLSLDDVRVCGAHLSGTLILICTQLGYEREKAAREKLEAALREGARVSAEMLEKLEADLAQAEQTICDFQAAGMIDVGGMGGPCEVKPAHIEKHVTELRARTAALEKALREARERMSHGEYGSAWVVIDAALAGAPDGEKRAPPSEPTHRCRVCGALWRQHEDGSYQLLSPGAGKCCDNVVMGDQIETLPEPAPAAGVDEAEALLRRLDAAWPDAIVRAAILRAALAAAERKGLERAAKICEDLNPRLYLGDRQPEFNVMEHGYALQRGAMFIRRALAAEQPAPEKGP
jgi:hypothetical protein